MTTPESKFLAEINKHDAVSPKDIDITVFECKTPGKRHTVALTGETSSALYVAEAGFLRKFTPRGNGRWNCEVLSALAV